MGQKVIPNTPHMDQKVIYNSTSKGHSKNSTHGSKASPRTPHLAHFDTGRTMHDSTGAHFYSGSENNLTESDNKTTESAKKSHLEKYPFSQV